MSLIVDPALRIIKAPREKTARFWNFGNACVAWMSAAQQGNRVSHMPTGLSSRASRVKGRQVGGKQRSTQSPGRMSLKSGRVEAITNYAQSATRNPALSYDSPGRGSAVMAYPFSSSANRAHPGAPPGGVRSATGSAGASLPAQRPEPADRRRAQGRAADRPHLGAAGARDLGVRALAKELRPKARRARLPGAGASVRSACL